jgi:hypothetical protein
MKRNNFFSPNKNNWDIGWPCSPRHFIIIILISVVVILFASCNEKRKQYEFKKKVLFEKREALHKGTTSYEFAYTDGTSDTVTYGLYATTKPNDTLYYIKQINVVFETWGIADKEIFYKYYNESNLQE